LIWQKFAGMEIGGKLYIYHEKQDAALCGVHCLNSLMQGDYFTEIDLMQLARELDEQERRFMMESGTDSKEFLTFMAEDSGNVADEGYYSIQVLTKALEVFGLHAIPILNPEMQSVRQNPLTEQAFICNLANHWLTIRKIGEDWWNLNSLQTEPQYLSDFYLSAFMDTLIHKGYMIFCVRGKLPAVLPNPSLLATGRWKKSEAKKCCVKDSKDRRSSIGRGFRTK
jgi:ataxin-3